MGEYLVTPDFLELGAKSILDIASSLSPPAGIRVAKSFPLILMETLSSSEIQAATFWKSVHKSARFAIFMVSFDTT